MARGINKVILRIGTSHRAKSTTNITKELHSLTAQALVEQTSIGLHSRYNIQIHQILKGFGPFTILDDKRNVNPLVHHNLQIRADCID